MSDYIDPDTLLPCGRMLFELQLGELAGVQYLTALYPGAAVYLSDSKGQLLYSSETDSEHRAAVHQALSESNADRLEADGIACLRQRTSLTAFGLTADVLIPSSDLTDGIYSTIVVYLLFTCVIALATLGLALTGYLLLARPLRRMVATMDELAGGNLSVRMEDTPYRETQNIVNAFNQMADRLGDLFDEVYEKAMRLREAEFRLLESQISPHFIFNVLEVINLRCMAAGQPGISKMVTSLAQLLRSNILHRDQQKITFAQELEYVGYYLTLQKERFADSLQYEIECEDDSLLSCRLPKLTI